jgi:hypothetical protein
MRIKYSHLCAIEEHSVRCLLVMQDVVGDLSKDLDYLESCAPPRSEQDLADRNVKA